MEKLSAKIFSKTGRKHCQYNLKWNLLRCVTTLGGKNMCGTNKGFLDQFSKPMLIYCNSHQKVLCRKYLNLSCVIEPTVSKVNFISFSGLNHCLFCELLSKTGADLLYHLIAVRCLNNNKSPVTLSSGLRLKLFLVRGTAFNPKY